MRDNTFIAIGVFADIAIIIILVLATIFDKWVWEVGATIGVIGCLFLLNLLFYLAHKRVNENERE